MALCWQRPALPTERRFRSLCSSAAAGGSKVTEAESFSGALNTWTRWLCCRFLTQKRSAWKLFFSQTVDPPTLQISSASHRPLLLLFLYRTHEQEARSRDSAGGKHGRRPPRLSWIILNYFIVIISSVLQHLVQTFTVCRDLKKLSLWQPEAQRSETLNQLQSSWRSCREPIRAARCFTGADSADSPVCSFLVSYSWNHKRCDYFFLFFSSSCNN